MLPRIVQNSAGEVASNGWKALEELFERIVILQIFEKCFYRDARSLENGRSAKHFGVNRDQIIGVHRHSLVESGRSRKQI